MSNIYRKAELFKHLLELAQTLEWSAAFEEDAETALLAKTLTTFFSTVNDPIAGARLSRALDVVDNPSQPDIDAMLDEILFGQK